MLKSWLRAAAVMVLVTLRVTGPAHAQASGNATAAEHSEFAASIEAGIQALDEQRPEEARVYFERAHALQPSARTLRALGLADYQLDHFTLARRELDGALHNRERPLTAEMEQEVRSLLQWMHANLSSVQLSYTPTHASATLDGRPVDSNDMVLAPGDHELVVSANGFITRQRTFQTRAAQLLSLTVELTRVEPPPPSAPSALPLKAAAPTRIDSIPRAETWPWIVGAAGAVSLVTGTTLFIIGRNDISNVEGAKKGILLSEIEAAHDRAPWLTGTGIGLGVAGLACLTIAAFGLGREHKSISVNIGPSYVRIAARF